MEKKKILVIYSTMMMGGSTTSLLSFLNCLDPSKYDVELQLFRNQGPLFDMIPSHVKILPEAQKYSGAVGRLIKIAKLPFSKYLYIAFSENHKRKQKGLSKAALVDFQVKKLSHRNERIYDYAIGFLEGWTDRYLAYMVNAEKKYAWIHSTFINIAPVPEYEVPWMKCVDKVVFVAENCKKDFDNILPEMAEKSIVIENILDSDIVKRRSKEELSQDDLYNKFKQADCFKIITVCRLDMNIKGLDRIVACAKYLKEHGKSFLWYIIGDGEDIGALQAMIGEFDVADSVILTGKRMNPYPFVVQSDIMCMPSRYEGKPMTVTESMILGIPPVVTEYLSAHEQIKNDVEGFIVDNQDTAIFETVLDCIEGNKKISEIKKYLSDQEYGNSSYMNEIEKILFS